jgi:hypothetical protein
VRTSRNDPRIVVNRGDVALMLPWLFVLFMSIVHQSVEVPIRRFNE